MFRNESGQIELPWIIGIGVTIAIASVTTFIGANYRNDAKVDVVKAEVSVNGQRLSKLEEAISTLKADNVELKADMKTIIKSNATILQILK